MKTATYDLEERTAVFGESVSEFCLELGESAATKPIISQLVRAATCIGANDCEADDAESKRDFRRKIALGRKESREPRFWCRMIAKAASTCKTRARAVWKEAREHNLIFARIVRTTDKNLPTEAAQKR